MKRRGFFGAFGAICAALLIGRKPLIREIEFSAPRQPPVIHWMSGHVDTQMFVSLLAETGLRIDPSQVARGWGSRKMQFISMYLSDSPLENFEPITYWIPADHLEATP